MAKKAKVWDGTAWQDLASATTDLTPYSTTAQMNTAIAASAGLTLIKSQTIGTAVSSVTVTDAFNTNYDNYKIILGSDVTVSTNMSLRLTLGASATGYEQSIISANSRSSSISNSGLGSNQTFWTIGTSVGDSTNSTVTFNLDVYAPFTTKRTMFSGWNAAFAGIDSQQLVGGLHLTLASYSAFTLTASTGTFTGGTIRVYGYQK